MVTNSACQWQVRFIIKGRDVIPESILLDKKQTRPLTQCQSIFWSVFHKDSLFLFIRLQILHYNFYTSLPIFKQVTKGRQCIEGVFNPVFSVIFIYLPVITKLKLSFQELEDFGAVLLILLRSISHSNGRHGHQNTRGAGPCDHHRQVSLYHQIHPLETWRRKSYKQGHDI